LARKRWQESRLQWVASLPSLIHCSAESLEQQTATAEILRVISSSPTDVQPVFDAIAASAARLCEASHASVYRFDGETISVAALFSGPDTPMDALNRYFPRPADDTHIIGRVIRTRRTLHVPDIGVDHRLPELQRALGYRTLLAVPIVRDDEPIGAIGIWRNEPKAFSDTQIELLKTFPNQAVIAIENVRLFKDLDARTHDLTRSVGELRALGEVGQAISSTLDLQTVLSTIVARATQLSGTDAGVIYEYDEHREVFLPRATERLEAEIVETMLSTPVRKGEGATGRLAETSSASRTCCWSARSGS
jgi:GAF domain-containing protein